MASVWIVEFTKSGHKKFRPVGNDYYDTPKAADEMFHHFKRTFPFTTWRVAEYIRKEAGKDQG